MKSWISDVGKVLGGMKVFSCRTMAMNVKSRLYGRLPAVEVHLENALPPS